MAAIGSAVGFRAASNGQGARDAAAQAADARAKIEAASQRQRNSDQLLEETEALDATSFPPSPMSTNDSKDHRNVPDSISPTVAASSNTSTSDSTRSSTSSSTIKDSLSDWSSTGRGSHVDFHPDEIVPLKEGRFLGSGSMGHVYETSVRGYTLAWKRITQRKKISAEQRSEIEILKKLGHCHMIQLVGTYTHGPFIGLLMYPVAVCDLHTYFEDVEAHWNNDADDAQQSRLKALNYSDDLAESHKYKASTVYGKIGCLVSAVAYLHDQKIRHKDLKPSNVLLSPDSIWLSDFGSATDFSLLSQSATDNERGTPRYFAPEVASWQRNGRAADMFSLGCILLEILVLHSTGSLERLRKHREGNNPAFHANLRLLDAWLPLQEDMSSRRFHLVRETRALLNKDPMHRPRAAPLLERLRLCDGMVGREKPSIFGTCCQEPMMTVRAHESEMASAKYEIESLKHELDITALRAKYERDVAMLEARNKIKLLEARLAAWSLSREPMHVKKQASPKHETDGSQEHAPDCLDHLTSTKLSRESSGASSQEDPTKWKRLGPRPKGFRDQQNLAMDYAGQKRPHMGVHVTPAAPRKLYTSLAELEEAHRGHASQSPNGNTVHNNP